MNNSLNETLEEFRRYETLTRHVKERSTSKYINYLKMLFSYIDKEPDEVSHRDIENYILHIKVDLKNAINTQKVKLAAIRIFYGWYSKRYHAQNPTELFGPIQEEVKIPVMPTPDELTRMVDACDISKDIGRRDAALICLFADTGIRVSECAALNVNNIQVHAHNFVLLVPRIKSRERMIPFGQLTQGAMVGEFFAAYFQDIKYLKNYKETDPLFKQMGPCYKDGRLGIVGIYKIIKKYSKQAEIGRRISPHSFRHFFGTYSVINGTRVEHLRTLMGHAWLETTMRYVHLAEVIEPDSIRMRGTSSLKAPPAATGFVEILNRARKKIHLRDDDK
jgi:site-specific recombinase XerD